MWQRALVSQHPSQKQFASEFTGLLPTHSSQKGGRAKGGISPASRSSLREEKGREWGQQAPLWRKEERQGRKGLRRQINNWQTFEPASPRAWLVWKANVLSIA